MVNNVNKVIYTLYGVALVFFLLGLSILIGGGKGFIQEGVARWMAGIIFVGSLIITFIGLTLHEYTKTQDVRKAILEAIVDLSFVGFIALFYLIRSIFD